MYVSVFVESGFRLVECFMVERCVADDIIYLGFGVCVFRILSYGDVDVVEHIVDAW